jgi:hypothetical protein
MSEHFLGSKKGFKILTNLGLDPLFPKEVDDVPDFSACTSDNEHKSLKATHTHAQTTQADIVTMNAALFNVFLANLPKAIHETMSQSA